MSNPSKRADKQIAVDPEEWLEVQRMCRERSQEALEVLIEMQKTSKDAGVRRLAARSIARVLGKKETRH
jgi:hypothetical protein